MSEIRGIKESIEYLDEMERLFIEEIVIEVLKKVKMRTPKDTGKAADNWQLLVGAQTPKDRPIGFDAISDAKSRMKSYKIGMNLGVGNGVEYIDVLEYGTKHRVGNKMAAVTAMGFR